MLFVQAAGQLLLLLAVLTVDGNEWEGSRVRLIVILQLAGGQKVNV
jgi:hypothetical protein